MHFYLALCVSIKSFVIVVLLFLKSHNIFLTDSLSLTRNALLVHVSACYYQDAFSNMPDSDYLTSKDIMLNLPIKLVGG